MKKRTINTVLVVGLGSIGKRHIGIINTIFSKVNVIVLRHKECDKEESNSPGIYQCVTTLDEAIGAEPQVAIIANPATKHVEVAKVLATHGIHIMVEKPISNNSKDAKELVEICEQNNIVLMVAYNLRFLPSLIYFKQCIQSDLIGKIYSVRSEVGQYLPSWRAGADYKLGVSANKSLGGGVLLELSHEIDYLRWIFGPISWVKSHISKQSDLDIDVEDSANIIFGFKDINGGELIASLNMDFIRHDTKRQCVAIGEKGTLLWDGITGEVKIFAKGDNNLEVLFLSNPESNFTYIEEIKDFFLSVERKKVINYRDALETIQVIDSIRKSSSEDCKVFI
jgi:predicted dehydrogenase